MCVEEYYPGRHADSGINVRHCVLALSTQQSADGPAQVRFSKDTGYYMNWMNRLNGPPVPVRPGIAGPAMHCKRTGHATTADFLCRRHLYITRGKCSWKARESVCRHAVAS
jgi:hypothetical protein